MRTYNSYSSFELEIKYAIKKRNEPILYFRHRMEQAK